MIVKIMKMDLLCGWDNMKESNTIKQIRKLKIKKISYYRNFNQSKQIQKRLSLLKKIEALTIQIEKLEFKYLAEREKQNV